MDESILNEQERNEIAEIYAQYVARKKAREAAYDQESAIEKAIAILQNGGNDAAHHMQWAIDQALRALMGEPRYEAWLLDLYKNGYDWDEGIAP